MGTPESSVADLSAQIEAFRADLARLEDEFARRIVGNRDILRFILKALFSGGHILLEGLPGLGKTLMVKTLAEILDLSFNRVQFTPDLMPADILGTNLIVEDERGRRHFQFEKGPVFTNILLADEINRASPKTQSALLQAMEEREATVFGERHPLDDVFLTLATQNPIEMAGTYPLPEAQLDRFQFKLHIPYPSFDDLRAIAQTGGGCGAALPHVSHVLTREGVLRVRALACQIPVTDRILEMAAELVYLTQPTVRLAPAGVRRSVRYGASPRALKALVAASQVSALMDGRLNLSVEDLRENYVAVLRHRIILTFEADVEGVRPEAVLDELFDDVARRY